jgi:phosphoribosylformimino-5-aminoimidazole carboxamide ribotide isomerase
MQVLPVLDIMNGQVVHGVGGNRDTYRPIVSKLTHAADPLTVARKFREVFALTELYVADLDAIGGSNPAYKLYTALLREGFALWIDAGLEPNLEVPDELARLGVQTIVAGLESLAGPEQLEELIERHGAGRIVFSLDAKGGKPLGKTNAWRRADLAAIAHEAVARGVERLLVLDLAAVGENNGLATANFCQELRSRYPDLEISTGGGVRGIDDLRALRQRGVDKVLVASALHDGRLTAAELAAVAGSQRSEVRGHKEKQDLRAPTSDF